MIDEISRGETETLEFKVKLVNPHLLNKTINSMINTRGGKIIIGVNDNGEIIGTDLNNNMIHKMNNNNSFIIKGINSSGSQYRKYLDVKRVEIEEKQILVIKVKKKLIEFAVNTDANKYVRIGSRST